MSNTPHDNQFFAPIVPVRDFGPRRMNSVGFSTQRLEPSPHLIEKKKQIADHDFSTIKMSGCSICGCEYPCDHADPYSGAGINYQTGKREECWDKCPICGHDLFYSSTPRDNIKN